METKTIGQALAEALPVKDTDFESDLIALADIVVTGIEAPWVHFRVANYHPDASGQRGEDWAHLTGLLDSYDPATGQKPRVVWLNIDTMRYAVARYVDNRIAGGFSVEEARKMVDGSYTDAVVADSILQFALYGEEIYS